MSIKSPRSNSARLALAGVAFLGLAFAIGKRATSAPVGPGAPGEAGFRAMYPAGPVAASTTFAGVDLAKLDTSLSAAGLRLGSREDHVVDDGGVVLPYLDAAGDVRLLVKIAVARDSAAARRFADAELHAVQLVLSKATDPALGDHVFADDAGRGEAIVVGAAGNVGFLVHVRAGATAAPRASVVASALRSAAVEGVLTSPTATVSLPSVVPLAGAPFTVTPGAGATLHLRAEGAYVAKGRLLRPFAAGPVTLVATVADDLGRVAEVRTSAVAK